MKLSHRGQLGDLWREAGLINIKKNPSQSSKPMRRSMTIGNHLRKGRGRGAPSRIAFAGPPRTARTHVYASVCLEIGMMVSSN